MTHLPGGSPRMQPTGLLGGGPAQRSIRAQESAQRSPEAEHDPSLAYPSNHSRYTMGSLALERDPEIAQLSLDQPKVVAAVEQLLGGPAVIAQWVALCNTPGVDTEEVTGAPFVDGAAAHYDYKPWRPGGSFLEWLFAIIPLSDYTPENGPFRVGPWDTNAVPEHGRGRILPSDGRVHQVEVSLMPPLREMTMLDPEVRRGDVVLAAGFCWHEGVCNRSQLDRFGIYREAASFSDLSSFPSR